MKRLLVLCSVFILVLALPAIATADWFENFDSYVLGSGLHGQGGWVGWGGSPGANAYVSNTISHSPPHSAVVAGASDIVHEYFGYISGVWEYRTRQYVPTDFSGVSYFILLNFYNGGVNSNWSTQVQFNSATDQVLSEFDNSALPLIMGRWVEILVVIDLNANTQTISYDGQVLVLKSWTEGVSGGGALSIAAVDLFANNASAVYYDDMSLAPPGATAIKPITFGRLKRLFR